MAVRILCAGDIHIGRQSSKVNGTYRTRDAWMAIVDLAIAEQVDVLALSGDLIDKDVKSYESIGPLTEGLARLHAVGIETVAVAGNHDYDVLPRIAAFPGMEQFHLIGRGGTWERHTVVRQGEPILHIDGWSFPAEHVRHNPMESYPAQTRDQLPNLGLLHAEVGVSKSEYAPVALNQFWGHDVDFWLLGHIHVPRQFADNAVSRALYPGSPYAMDPGESGAHGVWLLILEAHQPPNLELVPISPARYEFVNVDLTDVADEDGFQRVVTEALRQIGRTAVSGFRYKTLKEINCRIHYTGATASHKSVRGWAESAQLGLEIDSGDVAIGIDTWTTDVHPPVDLRTLAEGNDPVAETAKLILALSNPEPDHEYVDLLRLTENELSRVTNHAGYSALPHAEPPENLAQDLLIDQAWKLLSALRAQKEIA